MRTKGIIYLCGSHVGISANIPAMHLYDAHFGGFFTSNSTQSPVNSGKLYSNNTPQAYPAVRCGDAQTGGLIISDVGYAL